MSGAAVVRALLAAHAAVRELIPNETGIVAGVLPLNSPVPALSVHTIDESEIPTMARNLSRRTIVERVQVTALSRDYTEMKRLLKAAALGRGVHTGEVRGVRVLSVLPAGVGPEIPRDDGIYEQSRDFMVTFSEAN